MDDYFNPIMDSLRIANLGFYNMVLSREEDIEIVRNSPIPTNISVVDIVAENQPRDSLVILDCHRNFALESENREMIIAKKSGHYIFRDDPQLIIKTIITMYNKR